jgi:hypothetical protein
MRLFDLIFRWGAITLFWLGFLMIVASAYIELPNSWKDF